MKKKVTPVFSKEFTIAKAEEVSLSLKAWQKRRREELKRIYLVSSKQITSPRQRA